MPALPLFFSTRNRHKTRELAALLGGGFAVRDLHDLPPQPEVEETGATMEENAILKALALAREVRGWVVADDSGLEVDALDGAPGVYSARYAGEAKDDAANMAKVLKEMDGVEARGAQFHCALALAQEGRLVAVFHGIVRGRLTTAARGAEGFGYDPIFIPDGCVQTFAELGPATKNRLSHRARAVAQLRDFLQQ